MTEQYIMLDVLEALREYDHPDASIRELSDETGYEYKQVEVAIHSLRKQDAVVKSREVGRTYMYEVAAHE